MPEQSSTGQPHHVNPATVTLREVMSLPSLGQAVRRVLLSACRS